MKTSLTQNERDFIAGYTEAMLWANAMDGATKELEFKDFRGSAWPTENARKKIEEECLDFFGAMQTALEVANSLPTESQSFEDLGIDFALSRNGHGAGYFDHGNHPVWKELQKAARVYGESTLIVDENGNAEIL